MQNVLEKFLHKLLPDDVHERCRDKAFVRLFSSHLCDNLGCGGTDGLPVTVYP